MRTLSLLVLAATAAWSADNDWPGWRGPAGNGVSPLKKLPTTWSAEQNIAWSTPLEGKGHSSPAVWGNRVFLTVDLEGDPVPGKVVPKHTAQGRPFRNPDSCCADKKHTIKLKCFDAGTGKQVWETVLHDGEVYDETHRWSNYATTTPTVDGKFVYVSLGAEGFFKVDWNGKIVWKADLGKIDTVGLGYGPSPVLYKDKVIVLADQDSGEKSFIAALSTATGQVVWKTTRTMSQTWTTPVLVDGQLIVNASDFVAAYNPENGQELWRAPGPGGFIVHTPVVGAGMIFASVGFPVKKTVAIRLKPEEGQDRVAWTYTKGTSYIPSPLVYGDYLYLMSDSGMLTCLDARTGEPKYESKRVPKPAKFNSTMVAFDGKILLTSEDGDTFFIKAGPEFEVLSTGSVGEPVIASLALAGDSIYVRSTQALYRIREKK
jgi:outer membrane protein assembly factor BamB